MLQRYRDRQHAQCQLSQQKQKDRDIHCAGCRPDARIRQTPMDQDDTPGKGCDPGNPAHAYRQYLLGRMADPQCLDQPKRGQKAKQMPDKNCEDANMEQDRSKDQLLASQKLRRRRFPRERHGFIPCDRANDHHAQRDVGIDTKKKVMHHDLCHSAATG